MPGHEDKRLPTPTPLTEAWWQACQRQELLIQKCEDCGHHQFYPRSLCTACGSRAVGWTRAAGNGEVISHTVIRHAVSEAYAAEVPYVIALVRLDEGPVMMSTLTECEPQDVAVGIPVECVFETWTTDITMPRFRPRAPGRRKNRCNHE